MKNALYLLTLVTSQCISCELVSIEAMRKDVEAAFSAKSFAGLSAKYGESQPVELKLENEYEEDNPVTIFKFSSDSQRRGAVARGTAAAFA